MFNKRQFNVISRTNAQSWDVWRLCCVQVSKLTAVIDLHFLLVESKELLSMVPLIVKTWYWSVIWMMISLSSVRLMTWWPQVRSAYVLWPLITSRSQHYEVSAYLQNSFFVYRYQFCRLPSTTFIKAVWTYSVHVVESFQYVSNITSGH